MVKAELICSDCGMRVSSFSDLWDHHRWRHEPNFVAVEMVRWRTREYRNEAIRKSGEPFIVFGATRTDRRNVNSVGLTD